MITVLSCGEEVRDVRTVYNRDFKQSERLLQGAPLLGGDLLTSYWTLFQSKINLNVRNAFPILSPNLPDSALDHSILTLVPKPPYGTSSPLLNMADLHRDADFFPQP